MALVNVPLPIQDRIARARRENLPAGIKDDREGTLPDIWVKYFQSQSDTLKLSPSVASTPVSVTAQAASIGITAIPTSTLAGGLYRVSYYARITRAATVSSSLIVTIGWTETGVSLIQSGAAIIGNTTASNQNGTLFLQVDASSPVTYATTYASVGATTMQYKLVVSLEVIPQ